MYSPLIITFCLIATSFAKTVPLKLKSGLNSGYTDEDLDSYLKMENVRQRRQVHGSTYLNSDKSSGVNVKMPFAGDDKNVLSAIGSVNFDAQRKLQAATAGVALDNVNGHGLSLTNSHIPDFGNRLTAAGHLNVLHNENHDVTANAFLTRNMPSIPHVPNFNTMGGSVDYMYKNRVGASLGAAHTPFLQRTDYSATGNLNIFRDRTSSLDFNAGFSKFVSPFMKHSSWEPSTGFTFRKFF